MGYEYQVKQGLEEQAASPRRKQPRMSSARYIGCQTAEARDCSWKRNVSLVDVPLLSY